MSVLTLKLLRDLWASRWQHLAVGATVCIGVAVYGAATMSYQNLDISYAHSYERQRFEDFGIRLRGAPDRAVKRIQRIPGVKGVEGRLVDDVEVEIPGRAAKKLIGRLVSLPADRRPRVNDVRVTEGRYLQYPPRREVLLESSFAKYHDLHPGDTLEVVRFGAKARFRICGIVRTSEYIFVVRSKQDLMAFPNTFGVMFVAPEILGTLIGKPGTINEVRATVFDPAERASIAARAKAQLSAYGPEEPVLREDQPSHQLLRQDVEGFRVYSVLFPALFLSVAAVAIYSMLLRHVHRQRGIIGLLLGLGFGRGAVVRHYVYGAALVGGVASLAGTALGLSLSDRASRAYMGQIAVPYERVEAQAWPIVMGFLIGTSTCVLAAISPARTAARVRPAEMMRPKAPITGRTIRLDAVLGRAKLLWRIPLRNVFRQPRRTLSTMFGIAAGLALIITARGLMDSVNLAMDEIAAGVFRSDLRLEFIGYQDGGRVAQVKNWRGVVWAEGALDLPMDFEKDGVVYSAQLSGMEPFSLLHELSDTKGRAVPLPTEGIVLGPTLRKRLALEIGDTLTISLPEEFAEREPTKLRVRAMGFVSEPIGTVAYMRLDQLRRLFRKDLLLPPTAISGIRVEVDPRYEKAVRERLLELPRAGAVSAMSDLRKLIDDMMGFFKTFVLIMELFGAALAFSMVFNMVTLNVLERSAEAATMRTLGVGRGQVAWMITLENLIVAALGLVVGIPLGRLFLEGLWQAAQTEEQQELVTFEIQVMPATYLVASILVFVVAILSQWPGIRYLGKLNLARATKERAT